MLVTHFQKAFTYLKETQEIALFTTLSDAELITAFRTSPLFYAILPFISFLLTINALINGYLLAKESNRNVDRWLLFISSMACAVLASISFYGAILSLALGFSFVAAPWFFFSSLVVAGSHRLMMFGLSLFRAFESPPGSIQRMHYLQAAFGHLFSMIPIVAALVAVALIMLLPAAPLVGSIAALTAAAFTGFDIFWRVIPHNIKQIIKGWFYAGKPDLEQDALAHVNSKASPLHEKEPQHHRLFTHRDHSAVIRNMDVEDAKNYLLNQIKHQLHTHQASQNLKDMKTQDKIGLLKKLLKVMQEPTEISKKDALVRYPSSFQSFWAEKGEVEQLFDAMVVFLDKYQQSEVKTTHNTPDSNRYFIEL